MRWKGREQSQNVEDRRGQKGGGRRASGIGLLGIIIIIAGYFLGIDPSALLQLTGGGGQNMQYEQPANTGAQPTDELGQFVSVVLKDTEDVWDKIFREQLNAKYRKPTLVLFDGSVRSACGHASAATGPFYCPADEKLYIDLDFYRQLSKRFGAPGDFAMAYVVAHEVAHHVQNLLGYTDKVHQARRRVSEKEYNQLSVKLELMADFLAGVWAHHAHKMKNILEKGDVEEAMNAAHAIGDDNLQKQAQGYVVPDSFTHGTSEQRMRWFKKGIETGDISQGDTFNAAYL